MYYLEIAEKLAKNIWPIREKIKLVDLMLYGSLTYGKKNPNDIDLLLLHKNPLLDKFQFETIDEKIDDIQKFFILSRLLGKSINLEEIIKKINAKELIEKNLLHTKYMNLAFFSDNNYKKKWLENNQKHPDYSIKKNRIDNETFEECIFRQGKLWNKETGKYDIPALSKYNPKIILQPQNQL